MQLPETRDTNSGPKLHRVLGVRDMVLLNVAAIVGLRWLSTAAQIGPSSLVLWLLALVVFFVPIALCVLELSSRLPGEGGLYLWSKAAFGDIHGFTAGWCYWVSNLVFLPSALLFGAGVFLYIGGGRWLGLAENATYNGAFCLAVLWIATLLNISGLQHAKWLQNIGGIATWSAAVMVLVGGGIACVQFGAATAITSSSLIPDLASLPALATLASIAFAYVGLELGPIMGAEIKEPRRTIPRAMLISGVVIASIYIAGTAALLLALPAASINIISGIPQALAAVGERLGLPFFGPLTAGLVALGSIGSVSAWIAGTARLPFVVGVDRYLPKPLSALHPRFGTPHVALLTQSSIATLILLAAISGSTIHDAFIVLLDMSLILTFIPVLYLFASLPVLRKRAAANDEDVTLVPGGKLGYWIVSGLGFATTLLAIITSMVPPQGNTDHGLFFIKVIGGCIVLTGVGLALYAIERRSRRRA